MTDITRKARTLSTPPLVDICGVKLAALTESQTVDQIMHRLDAGHGGWVITPNLDILRRISRDDGFRALAQQADLLVADGMPLVWASRLQHTPLPERVAGSSLTSTLTAAAATHGRSVFFVGGEEGAAEDAACVLRKQHPSLRIAGHCCPPLGFEKDALEMRKLREALLPTRPDIVYVALGCPKQEHLIATLRPELPNTWWLGVGISFSFLCGRVHRAPQWMQKAGMEWVHRLVQEPRRLARRYLVDDMPFAVRLLLRSAFSVHD